jgi:hypothetical protein
VINPEQLGTGTIFAFGLFIGTLILLETGRRLRIRARGRTDGREPAGLGAVDGALFGLLGLMLAFTFSGAAARFDDRRQQIVEEATAIGTAYLRLELLPPGSRDALEAEFRRYLQSRLAVYKALPDFQAARAELARSDSLQIAIWTQAVSATQAAPTTMAGMLLLPALNQMFDITTVRTVAAETHPPSMIYGMLGVLVLVCALLAGYAMGADGAARSWVHVAGFAAVLALTIYLIIDLEYPRLGFIRLTRYDQVLVNLLNQMR